MARAMDTSGYTHREQLREATDTEAEAVLNYLWIITLTPRKETLRDKTITGAFSAVSFFLSC